MENKKGQGGLNLYLTIIVFLFVSGLIVYALVLAAASIQTQDNLYTTTSVIPLTNQTYNMSTGGFTLNESTLRNVVCTLAFITNYTNGVTIAAGNYTQTNCVIANASAEFTNYFVNVTYNYTYALGNEALTVVNATKLAAADSVDWFPIIITLGAVLVLILLVVLIITSLRGAGLMGGNGGA